MNKKFLAALAIGAASLGSAVFSAPAQAVEQEVQIDINMQPLIYLRTFEKVNLPITAGNLGIKDKDFDAAVSNGKTPINKTRPVIGTAGDLSAVKIPIDEVYALWTNSTIISPDVKPSITKPDLKHSDGSSTAKITNIDLVKKTTTKPTLRDPEIGGVNLTFDLTEAVASGAYTGGAIKIEAIVP